MSRWQLDKLSPVLALFFLRFLVIFIVFFLRYPLFITGVLRCITIGVLFSIGSFWPPSFAPAISYGFSYYITNFGSYNKVYSSIGR